MREVVVDASLAAKWVVAEPLEKEAKALLSEWLEDGVTIIVPPLWEAEVDTALEKRIYWGRRKLDPAQVDLARKALDLVPVSVKYVSKVRRRARKIARQFKQEMVYDSTYAALAQIQGCEFWTADKRFYRAVKGKLGFVKYLGDYKAKVKRP